MVETAMKMLPRLVSLSLISVPIALALSACAQSTIIPFDSPGGGKPVVYAPTQAQTVGIYRSTHPFPEFIELGLMTYRAGAFDLPSMYDQLRKDAAAHGAEAVVDVKIHSESKVELQSKTVCVPITDCDAQGKCTTHNDCKVEEYPERVSIYLVEGSMIRRKP